MYPSLYDEYVSKQHPAVRTKLDLALPPGSANLAGNKPATNLGNDDEDVRASLTLQLAGLGRHTWLSILLISIGWGVGWPIGEASFGWASIWARDWGAGMAVLAAIAGAYVGAVGGLSIGLALRWVEPSTEWQQVLVVALGWVMAWAMGWNIGYSLFIMRPTGWVVAAVIIGGMGSLITVLASRQPELPIQWNQMFVIVMGWIMGWAIASAIRWHNPLFDHDVVSAAISGIVGGAIGGGVMYWQLKQSRRGRQTASVSV